MFASLLQFLFLTATSILGCLLVLRAWTYACAMTFHDPIVYPIRRLTNWLVDPLSKMVAPKGAWDWPSLVGALLAGLLSVVVRTAFHPAGFAMVSTWIAPFAMVLRWGLEMLTWGIFGWVILLTGILEVLLSTANRHFITGRGWMLAGGIIEIVLGVILILNVGLSAATLPLFLGFWLMMRGFSTIGLGGDMRALGITGAGWTILTGILLVICSLGVLLQPTAVGTTAVVVWVGVTLLFAGMAAGSLALQFRNAHRCFEEEERR